ncbi:MAG: AhpC/TSA family protein [Tannerella sp.]|nr:AhpC/TSA family protein [Tannerella sp.]
MKRNILHLLCLVCGLWMMNACKHAPEFAVTGIVAGADGQTMYLENIGISSAVILDSAKLNSSGKFEFKQPRPEYPDFYRLRLNDQLINFAIDSTETISFIADAGTFATSYSVEGSENSTDIRAITLAQLDANEEIKRIRKEYESGLISDTTYQLNALNAINTYKEVALKYIYTKPMSTPAYFALFQKIDGLLFFDLYDKSDSRAYGAVATSFNHLYPESPRAKHLYNLALQSLKVLRSNRTIDVDKITTQEIDFLDIDLPNLKGEKIKLSEAAKDKIVILNFTAYQTEWSLALNQILNTLYTDLHDKGLEIYQVSLDSDAHLWKNIASDLPWICVQDPQSVYSQTAALYNVRQLPTVFILNQQGILTKRIEEINTLEKDIRAMF